MHGGIGVEDAAIIGLHRLRAFLRRKHAQKVLVQRRIELRQARGEGDLDFSLRAEKRRTQCDAGNARGMRLRISERQRRAP